MFNSSPLGDFVFYIVDKGRGFVVQSRKVFVPIRGFCFLYLVNADGTPKLYKGGFRPH